MVISNYAVCSSKNSRLINEEEACGLLSSFGIKALLSQIPIVGTMLF